MKTFFFDCVSLEYFLLNVLTSVLVDNHWIVPVKPVRWFLCPSCRTLLSLFFRLRVSLCYTLLYFIHTSLLINFIPSNVNAKEFCNNGR